MDGLSLIGGAGTQIRRFDSYWEYKWIPENSVLKVDTDAHTFRTLQGFGILINKFRFIVVEVCWDDGIEGWGQAHDILQLMASWGFNKIVCLDADYNNGKCNYCDLGFYKG